MFCLSSSLSSSLFKSQNNIQQQ